MTHSAIVLIFAKNNVWACLPDAVCHRLLATACARPATSAPQMVRQQMTDRYITVIIPITLIMTIMKPTRLALMLLVAMATTTFVACSDDEERGEIEPIRVELNQVTQTDFAACSNGFANDLLAVLAAQPSAAKGNVVVSPISMQYLLSMMANTASVEAQAEVFDALGLTTTPWLRPTSTARNCWRACSRTTSMSSWRSPTVYGPTMACTSCPKSWQTSRTTTMQIS